MRAKALLLGLAVLAGGCGLSPSPAVPLSGRKAPNFHLKDLQGVQHKLTEYRGKVVLLDFWATWCPPCRESIPALRRLHGEYSSRGVQVLGLSMDEDPQQVTAFAGNMGIEYTVLLAGGSQVGEIYRIRGIPTFYLVNKKGEAVRRWVGFDPSFPKEWRAAIDELLKA